MTLLNFGDTHKTQKDNPHLYVNCFHLFLHVVVELLDGVEAGFEPPVLLVPLTYKILQLAHLSLVFLVTHTDMFTHIDQQTPQWYVTLFSTPHPK